MFKSFISIALLLFSSIIHASTVPNIKITLDGKIWATVHKGSYQSTTRPLFGDEMDALCGREEQGCVGTSSTGVNLTGWKWASEASIIDLANSILPQPLDIPANFTRNEDTSSFLDIFGITAIDEGIGFFLGYGATKTDKRNSTYLPTLDIWANCGGVTISIYCAGDIHRLGQAHLTKRGGLPDPLYDGAYLVYKDLNPVPLPPALLLFAPALFGLIGFRRIAKNAA